MDRSEKKIFDLLDKMKESFPSVKEKTEKLMKEMGLDETIDLSFEAPSKVATLPTFDKSKSHKLTPMLKARFEYASTIKSGGKSGLILNKWYFSCQTTN